MSSVKDGIDVSEHNGDVDWGKVASDAGFAFVKATEGRTYTDARLTPARCHAAERALPKRVGYYAFARPDNNDPEDEARHFVQSVRKAGGRLGRNGVLDYEVAHPHGDDEKWIRRWVAEYRKLTGKRPIIYGGSILRERTAENFGCPLWIAAYVRGPVTPYLPSGWHKRGWRCWQFTDKGVCKGITGYVDRNRFRGDRKALGKFMS